MLRSLLPKAHPKFLAMPVLGPIVNGFDDWLSANGYTRGSREFSIRILPRVDAELRRRQIDDVAKLTHPVLHNCWKRLMKTRPEGAGAVQSLERYLLAEGLIADDRQATTPPSVSILSEEYANHLREVCGFAASTISSHWRTAECFLRHLEKERAKLQCIQLSHIESYIAKTGKRLSRGSLQHDIGAFGLPLVDQWLATCPASRNTETQAGESFISIRYS
jgi:integrase/recombinase XerD